jgi:hypothetical protein
VFSDNAAVNPTAVEINTVPSTLPEASMTGVPVDQADSGTSILGTTAKGETVSYCKWPLLFSIIYNRRLNR